MKRKGNLMSRKQEKKKSSGIKTLFILIILIAIAGLGVYFGYNIIKGKSTKEVFSQLLSPAKSEQPENMKKINIFTGEERPIACMIDNHIGAWPQFSINEAYTVYEIIVEGGETRLMALFKGKDVDMIGPMRSSRHYFLDYALENDAIYAHIGWSPKAQSDIKSLGVNNINGLIYDTGKAWKEGSVFWRISKEGSKTYLRPHNSVTSTTALMEAAKKEGYRTTSKKKSVLNYVADEITLDGKADAKEATKITIPFSTLQKVEFKYDEKTKRYTRYARGKVQKDAAEDKNITTKNIIITFAENSTLQDGSGKGRQDIKNIGEKKGYYITNGMSIPITCTKKERSSQTVYKDKDGKEINVNDGNTFIEICPKSAKVTIK